ncbi:hypothetical protein TKK_0004637 [Trichogramma kaykai]|uniref:EF-hand domain-containing protein n=1 Tax=Trichogramma kaykai TaxID=54128 RepID=A0ABD2XM44_9HYME
MKCSRVSSLLVVIFFCLFVSNGIAADIKDDLDSSLDDWEKHSDGKFTDLDAEVDLEEWVMNHGSLFHPDGVSQAAQDVWTHYRELLRDRPKVGKRTRMSSDEDEPEESDINRTKFSPKKVSAIKNFLLYIQKLDRNYDTFISRLEFVNELYKQFLIMQFSDAAFLQLTKKNFAENTRSRHNTVEQSMRTLHDLFRSYDGLVNYVTNENALVKNESIKKMCEYKLPPHVRIFDTYKMIALAEIKTYVLLMWKINYFDEEGFFLNESWDVAADEEDFVLSELEKRMETLYNFVKPKLKIAHRDLWRCDPIKHVKGKTYEEFGPVIQKYIMIENAPYPFELVKSSASGYCTDTCSDYRKTEQKGCSVWNDDGCAEFAKNKCNGTIHMCEEMKNPLTVCPSDGKSDRRYEFIEFADGEKYGHTDRMCPTDKVYAYAFPKLFWKCDYCVCTCEDDSSEIDRFVSLREATSDIEENKIVTGIRLKKKNHIFHIQIQQSRLLPHGEVDEDDVSWKPLNLFKVHDEGVKEDTDYYKISWDRRGFALDNIILPIGFVMTGVKFFQSDEVLLSLSVRSTQFDFNTGKLRLDKSAWRHVVLGFDPQNPFPFNNSVSPIQQGPDFRSRGKMRHWPDSKPGQYLELVNSDFKKDLGQTVLPFVDVQSVKSRKPVPLAGAGLHHRGLQGSGGFLALKMFSYDFEPHMQKRVHRGD